MAKDLRELEEFLARSGNTITEGDKQFVLSLQNQVRHRRKAGFPQIPVNVSDAASRLKITSRALLHRMNKMHIHGSPAADDARKTMLSPEEFQRLANAPRQGRSRKSP